MLGLTIDGRCGTCCPRPLYRWPRPIPSLGATGGSGSGIKHVSSQSFSVLVELAFEAQGMIALRLHERSLQATVGHLVADLMVFCRVAASGVILRDGHTSPSRRTTPSPPRAPGSSSTTTSATTTSSAAGVEARRARRRLITRPLAAGLGGAAGVARRRAARRRRCSTAPGWRRPKPQSGWVRSPAVREPHGVCVWARDIARTGRMPRVAIREKVGDWTALVHPVIVVLVS